jgi:hypothetical protein
VTGPAGHGGQNGQGGQGGTPSRNNGQSASSAALERRYRRLLAWYPPAHRGVYGDEMLGVLMAAAAARGASCPGPAEMLNLVGSGLAARFRALGTGTDPAWRYALTLYSLAAPVLLTVVAYEDPWFLRFLIWGTGSRQGGINLFAVLHLSSLHLSVAAAGWITYVVTMMSQLTPVFLSLLGLRRTAIAAAAVLLSWTAVQASLGSQFPASNTAAFLAALAVEVAALIVTDGPPRAVRLLTWKGLLMAAPWLVITVAVMLAERSDHASNRLHTVLEIAVLGAVATLASAKARRLLLLFAIPVSSFAILLSSPTRVQPNLMFLPPALLSLLVFVVSRRRASGSEVGEHGQHPPVIGIGGR